MIAHRLATLDRADMILVLDHGHVAELGDRATLAADPASRYARLLHASSDASTDEPPDLAVATSGSAR